jgi:transposase
MVGVKTNIVTSIEMTPEHTHDSTQAEALIDTTSRNFAIGEVTADAAYLARPILDAVERVGGVPYIPFKSNSKPGKHEAWQRLWHLFHANKRTFLSHYHARSNVETTFSMIKRKFGGSVRSKKVESQMNEVLCKVLCHNLCVLAGSIYELGIDPAFGDSER